MTTTPEPAALLDLAVSTAREAADLVARGRASAAAKDREDLSYPEWAKRVDRYFDVLEAGLWPDLIIVGGGVSKKSEKWVPLLTTRTEVVPAQLLNDAGIVGAALAAHEHIGQ